MPTLEFKGKQHIRDHHLTVPVRHLVPDPAKSHPINSAVPDGNLIIHGDNLHALKALLPRYAGRIKCIYIDPPYNTGNEGWVYNNNVNSPLMQEWLDENISVDGEDLDRHDNWLCMMWPRLQLLRALLSDDGILMISIDDHEQWRLLGLLEDVFGTSNFVATLTFVQNLGAFGGQWLRQVTEYVHVFAKDVQSARFGELPADEDPEAEWLQDDVGYFREGSELLKRGEGSARADRPNLFYPVFVGENDTVSLHRRSDEDVEVLPIRSDGTEGRWVWSTKRFGANFSEVIVRRKKKGGISLLKKLRPELGDLHTTKPRSLWYKPHYSTPSGRTC